MVAFATFLCLVSATFTFALPYDDSTKRSALPVQWHHRDDHPVSKLFRRQNTTLPTVGSAEWTALYPAGPPESNIPAAWTQALAKAVADGKIPNITVPTIPNGNDPDYGAGTNNTSPEICSSYYSCRADGDIWDAPDGTLGISFDDGPVSDANASPRLYDFLKQNNQKATHFMIGSNILTAPQMFLRAFSELGDDIAVHTWSHRHTSTLTNEQIVAELGWCIQIIHDSTGGRVPAFWRPPYGDSDNRVRAIAKELFGLTTVIWDQDSDDWNIGLQGNTLQTVEANMAKWLAGPKSPGLVILEHEISDDDVTNFITSYPLMKSNGWQVMSIAQIAGRDFYRNSKDNASPVTPLDNFAAYPRVNVTVSSSTSSSSKPAAATTSSQAPATTSVAQNNRVSGGGASPTFAPGRLTALVFLASTLGAYFV